MTPMKHYIYVWQHLLHECTVCIYIYAFHLLIKQIIWTIQRMNKNVQSELQMPSHRSANLHLYMCKIISPLHLHVRTTWWHDAEMPTKNKQKEKMRSWRTQRITYILIMALGKHRPAGSVAILSNVSLLFPPFLALLPRACNATNLPQDQNYE